MDKKLCLLFLIPLIIGGVSCNRPDSTSEANNHPLQTNAIDQPDLSLIDDPSAAIPSTGTLIQPEDFVYLGFFRLPEPSGESDWDYSGHGLTYYPDGDPAGDDDGFPGSLFGYGHDHQLHVSEINIPEPVVSKNLGEANTAGTLQSFADITGGIFNTEEMTIPRAGLVYMADPEPRLHFAFGQHIQDFESSHGWAALDLSNPEAKGAWVFDGYTNYVTNDYLFEIPHLWSELISTSPLIASGRAREGLWSGRGPALFAYPVGDLSKPKPAGSTLGEVIPLLLYGEQQPGQPDLISSSSQAVMDYHEADHWWGGAWLTAGDGSAVVFAGTKALGEEWYGFANGVVWEHDCAEQTPSTCPDLPEWPYDDRGFWAEEYQAQLIFYDPAHLVGVAQGEYESWQPQPYATLVLDDYLLDPTLNLMEYKRDLVGAAAFDRIHGLYYIFERLADEYRSIVHVWQINR
ncbi:MAG: hypothetical protein MUO54_10710 [Anaerolineales bacterium]|nr:hypothetical protein [Anaerolineales bacterium]